MPTTKDAESRAGPDADWLLFIVDASFMPRLRRRWWSPGPYRNRRISTVMKCPSVRGRDLCRPVAPFIGRLPLK